MIKIGLIEDESLEFLTKKVEELKKQLEQANAEIKNLKKNNKTEIYKNLSRKYSSNIIKVLLNLKLYKMYLDDIVNSKEYNNNKLCEDCDINNNAYYDIEKITKNYCPFAPICAIEEDKDFDIDEIIKILEVKK